MLRVQVRCPVPALEVEQVCDRVRARLAAGGVRNVDCQVQGTADLGAVALLVRLELLARRAGARLRVRSTGAGLDELLRLTGLADALGR